MRSLDDAPESVHFRAMGASTDRRVPHLTLVSALLAGEHARFDRQSGAARPAPKPEDAKVRAAIEHMRQALEKRWTVTELARRVGLSRPVFARRFVEATGISPLRYLAGLRMERAAELLRTSDESLARVGSLVGYDSEFAFNRAFKRHHRLAPGGFRRLAQSAGIDRGITPVLRAAA